MRYVDTLPSGVVTGLLVAALIALASWAWARDRLPIRVRSAPRPARATSTPNPHAVSVLTEIDDGLPPRFVFPTPPRQPAPDPWASTERYIKWAADNGGVPLGRFNHRFTIRGAEDTAVHLEKIAVRVLDRRDPLHGTVVGESAGGDSVDRYLIADLDDVDEHGYAKTEQAVDEWDAQLDDFVSRPWNLLTVSRTDVETFVLSATTDRYDCQFIVEVHYQGEHRSGIVRLEGERGPFRVSAHPYP